VAEEWDEIRHRLYREHMTPNVNRGVDMDAALESACKRIAELERVLTSWLCSDVGTNETTTELLMRCNELFRKMKERIAELEAENKQLRERLEFFEDDEYRPTGVESIQERYRGASEP
jgi:Mg2+ and Co2+ transporter CorA